jgi:imidazole glycerol-phosphate synthase subunit HisH
MKIVIIKYNAGNIRSVLFAMERIGVEAEVSDDPEIIKSADKIIFPGVGEANSAMAYLRERKLDKLIQSLEQPVLGVCLGLQLLCSYSEENDTECLGIFTETVKKFSPLPSEKLKVPQMGWNDIYELKSPLFKGIPENSYCYFVHGYYAGLGETTIAKTNYVQPYSSALHRDNFYGVQFHPEKSAETGERILKNFIQL